MANTISNTDDTIDSRDVIARIEELQADESKDDADKAELAALEKLAAEAEGYCDDWQYGAQLVRDSYFKEHAQELAEDCGMIPRGLKWPVSCIDWDQAARELKMDYTSVDFDGVEYWVR